MAIVFKPLSYAPVCNLITCSYLYRDKFKIEHGFFDYWELIIIESGSYRVKINGVVSVYREGDIIFVPAYQKFRRRILERMRFFHIRFVPNENKPLAAMLPVGKLDFENRARVDYDIEMLKEAHRAMFEGAREVEQHIINDIFVQYFMERRSCPSESTSVPMDTTVYTAINYFHEHLGERIRMDELAASLSITPTGLILKFRRVTGTTPGGYLIGLRTELAKQLLLESSLTVTQIAAKCGYDNSYYFSNAFKKQTGLSPSAFRAGETV